MTVRWASIGLAALLVLSVHGTTWAQVRQGSLEEELFNSVRSNDLGGVRATLDAGANVFATNMVGNRAADVAVDLGFFDIAHYLLSVMDHQRANQREQTQTPDAPLMAQPQPAPPPPVVVPKTTPTVKATAPAAPVQTPPPVVTGPNPFAVTTPPQQRTPAASQSAPTKPRSLADIIAENEGKAPITPEAVTLRQPQVSISKAKTPTALPPQKAPVAAPLVEPESSLYVQPQGDEVARAVQPPPKPVVQSPPQPQQQPQMTMPAVKPFNAAPAPQAVAAEVSPPPQPVSEPEPADEGWFSKMTSFFTGGEDEPAAEVAQDQPVAEQKTTLPAQPVQIAATPPATPIAAPTESRGRKVIHLTGGFALGKTPPAHPQNDPRSMKIMEEWPCVSKGRWGIVCVEAAAWPDDLMPYFGGMRSNLYRGTKVVAGYKGGAATSYYAVFRTSGFDAVVNAFTERLGPPDLVSQRGVRPFRQLMEANLVRTWYGYDPQAGQEMVLEIAKYDDKRSTFPVMEEGFVKLSYQGESSVFRYTAPIELQRFN